MRFPRLCAWQGSHQASCPSQGTRRCRFARGRVNPHPNVHSANDPETIGAKLRDPPRRSLWPSPCTRANAEDTLVMTDRRSLLVGVALGVLASGCGDAPRAAAPAPPPPVVQVESVVERDVPISAEWVGTLVGYVDAQIRARVSGHLFSLELQGGLARQGRRPPLPGRSPPVPDRPRAGRGETPPRGIERGPGEVAGERQSGAGRAGPRLGGAGGGQRHQGGGDPEAVRARRRPLHARGRRAGP